MSIPPEPTSETEMAFINPDRRLAYILTSITEHIHADIAVIYTFGRESGRPEISAWVTHEPQEIDEKTGTWLWAHLQKLTPVSMMQVLYPEHLPDRCVLLWPLTMWDSVIGALVLISDQDLDYGKLDLRTVEPLVLLAQTTLENLHLAERLITTEAIALTAQAIVRNPSPQNIVHVLRDYLFDVHISSCVIGLFGPVREDHPNGPFDYIEIRGAWSRNGDSTITINNRIDLANNQAVINRLARDDFITVSHVDDLPPNDFTRLLIDVDDVQAVTLVSLHAEGIRLGILAIATDEPYEFTSHELRSYQIVAEFLTMSTMAVALQQQADYVQQSRAALLDAVTDGVVMVLPDEVATVLTINEQFTEMFGIAALEAQGLELRDLLERLRLPDDVRQNLAALWLALPTDAADKQRGEFPMTGPTGMNKDIQWYSGPVYKDGYVIGRLFTFHDITPDRATERLRYELLSRISHELRTPLTSIRGFAEFILEAERDNLPELALEYTEIILKSSKHLNHIFTDIIDITRANTGQLKLQQTTADLSAIIHEVSTRMQPMLRERGQTISLELDANVPDAYFDIDRVDQVLTNLINNAIKYSEKDSTIHVTMSHIVERKSLPEHAPQDTLAPCVMIGIIDEGPGLSKKDAEKIFLPFYRTRDARVQKIEGAGLGLPISSSIVELHRGRLWAEPATRKKPGGRFYFTLPITE